jgi:hypothetical protein
MGGGEVLKPGLIAEKGLETEGAVQARCKDSAQGQDKQHERQNAPETGRLLWAMRLWLRVDHGSPWIPYDM